MLEPQIPVDRIWKYKTAGEDVVLDLHTPSGDDALQAYGRDQLWIRVTRDLLRRTARWAPTEPTDQLTWPRVLRTDGVWTLEDAPDDVLVVLQLDGPVRLPPRTTALTVQISPDLLTQIADLT